MRYLLRLMLWIVLVLAVAAAVLAAIWHRAPSLAPYDALRFPPAAEAPPTGAPHPLRVTWVGVATLLLDDGETALMTDGFFTRPGLLSLLRIEPDREVIAQSLQRLHVSRLAAVMPLHSHHDHALDSAVVAQSTGALLVGSESTLNIGRGAQLPTDRLRHVQGGDTLSFGRFKVTWVKSPHSPGAFFEGEITAPLSAPARAADYRMGDCFALLIEHDDGQHVRRVLVQGSAGFTPSMLAGRQADVVFLGIAPLGKQPPHYQADLWRELVQAVHARRVVPIHWDNFFDPLSDGLHPMNRLMDNFDNAMHFVQTQGQAQQIDVRLPTEWQTIDPFWNLPAQP
ncbi:MBL fold metallo-hydrolase [Aquabacterium sp.]|uniref:MBL fold metallo-hydrolase n=1 Tax=Aquabacterium sp. TaxID=1872578 RepID=UPI0035AE0EEE